MLFSFARACTSARHGVEVFLEEDIVFREAFNLLLKHREGQCNSILCFDRVVPVTCRFAHQTRALHQLSRLQPSTTRDKYGTDDDEGRRSNNNER